MHEKGIETFLAVAMSRTLGKAAELLNVTQSTVSYNLRELETEMGMILVDRQKGIKSIRLTPAGEGFLPLALKWQEVNREISNTRNPGSAYALSIGGSESVNCRLLPDVYMDLMSNDPPVYLRIYTDPSDQMYQAVESRAVDVAIVLHEETTKYVQIEKFYTESLVLARVPDEGENLSKAVSPSDLMPEMEFYIEWGSGYRLWHDHVWDPMRSVKMRLDSVNLVAVMMVKPGQWCLVPRSAVKYLSFWNKKIVFQDISDAPPDLIYYKITHRCPKASAIAGLALFDETAKKHGFEKTQERDV
jgi:DNA-binding transcriptional LysR family regulator